MSFNVCFNCTEAADVKTCKNQTCFAYAFRNEELTLDHELNKEVNLNMYHEKYEMRAL